MVSPVFFICQNFLYFPLLFFCSSFFLVKRGDAPLSKPMSYFFFKRGWGDKKCARPSTIRQGLKTIFSRNLTLKFHRVHTYFKTNVFLGKKISILGKVLKIYIYTSNILALYTLYISSLSLSIFYSCFSEKCFQNRISCQKTYVCMCVKTNQSNKVYFFYFEIRFFFNTSPARTANRTRSKVVEFFVLKRL